MLRVSSILLLILMTIGMVFYPQTNKSVFSEESKKKVKQVDYARVSNQSTYKLYGYGYKDLLLLRIDVENIDLRIVLFLTFLVFPEVKRSTLTGLLYPWQARKSPIPISDELGHIESPPNLMNRISVLITYLDKDEADRTKSENQLLRILQKIAYDYLCLTQMVTPDSMKARVRKINYRLEKAQEEFAQLLTNSIDDKRLLSIIYLVRGVIYDCLKQYQDALKMYSEVISCNIDDFSLAASFYKAGSTGALFAKSKEVKDIYREITWVCRSKWLKTKPEELKALSKSAEAKKVYGETLTRYKRLKGSRKIIFIWCKERIQGYPEPSKILEPEEVTLEQPEVSKPEKTTSSVATGLPTPLPEHRVKMETVALDRFSNKVDDLVNALSDERWAVRNEATKRLMNLTLNSEEITKILVEKDKASNDLEKSLRIRLIGAYKFALQEGKAKQIQDLIKNLTPENKEQGLVKEMLIARQLISIPFLIQGLENEQKTIRIACIEVLGDMHWRIAIPYLITELQKSRKDPGIYRAIWKSLRKLMPLKKMEFDKEVPEIKILALMVWWDENKSYLARYIDTKSVVASWGEAESDRQMTETFHSYFIIDEEAKKAKIPTEEYRKTHSWSKEDRNK